MHVYQVHVKMEEDVMFKIVVLLSNVHASTVSLVNSVKLVTFFDPSLSLFFFFQLNYTQTFFKKIAPGGPCSPNPCLNGGTCTPGAGGTFTCTCSGGFTGPNCQAGEF